MKSLSHLNDFDFTTLALGALRIGSLSAEGRKEALARVQTPEVNGTEFSKWVFEQVAYIITGDPKIDEVCGGPSIKPDDAASLSEDELSQFAEKYGLRFFGTGQKPSPDDERLGGVDYLVYQIRETNRVQRERHSKALADINRLHNDPTVKAMREFDRINKLINPLELQAIRQALEIKKRFDDIQKFNSPFDDLRKQLDTITGWRSVFEGLHKPNSIVGKFNSMFNADTAVTSAFKQLQGTDNWRASLEHARNTFAHQSGFDSYTRSQRAFHDIQRQWELPRHLVESIGALSALQEQVGRLTLPTLDWVSAAELVRSLGPSGLQAQLAALGIDEHGELVNESDGVTENRLLSPMRQDLLALLSFIISILFFIYQEQSSGKWQDNVDTKLDSHTVVLTQQAKQLESLSVLVERALAKEARIADTRFVTLERGAIVYRCAESGSPKSGRLLPREVVTLISESGKWIEVRYYDWSSREYATGWVLKKYFTRVPPSRQSEE